MDWSSFSHFLHMDGHGAYVWAAYGMCVLLLVIELFGLRSRRAKAAVRVKSDLLTTIDKQRLSIAQDRSL